MADMTVNYFVAGVYYTMRIAQDDFEQWLDDNPEAVLAEIIYGLIISARKIKKVLDFLKVI